MALQNLVRSDLLSYLPICDRNLDIVGMQIMGCAPACQAQDNPAASALATLAPILNAFMTAGIDGLFAGRPVHVKVYMDFLMHDAPLLLPRESTVLVLGPTQQVSAELVQRCATLAASGFTLALDDWLPGDVRAPLLPHVQHVRVSMHEPEAATAMQAALTAGVPVLATAVDDAGLLQRALELGADWLEGLFYLQYRSDAKPCVSVLQHSLLEIIAELNSEGSDTRLEEYFKANPGVNLQLLRMVNSPAVSYNLNISSTRQAIAILGRAQLLNWLQVLLYRQMDGGRVPSPLLQAVLWRARFMEILAANFIHKLGTKVTEMAFLCGMVSLAHVLLARPIAQLLEEMRLAQSIREAVLECGGPLGTLLDLADALQTADFPRAAACVQSLGLSNDVVMSALNQSLAWSNSVRGHEHTNL